MRADIFRLAGQMVAYAAFCGFVGYFASYPVYRHASPEQALIKLSFSHPGARKEQCRRLTPEEIAALPANMRRPMDCPRERVPLVVELELDGKLLYHDSLPPSGLAGDGMSTAYARFPVPPGRHRLVARLRDTPREEGFDFEKTTDIELGPRQIVVLDFRADAGGFRVL